MSRPKAHLTLVLSSRRKASPGACPIILNYDSLCICFIYYLCITYYELIGTLAARSLGFLEFLLVCLGR